MESWYGRPLLGDWWRYSVSLVGSLLLAGGASLVLADGQLTGLEATHAAGLLVFALALVAFGSYLAVVLAAVEDMVLVLGWTSAGIAVLAAVGIWFQVAASTGPTTVESTLFVLTTTAAGGLFGSVVGYYDRGARALAERAGRETARREYLTEQREALSTMNGILRHQVLNDVSAIAGKAELLKSGEIDSEEAADVVLDHSDHVVAVLRRLETISDVLARTTHPQEVEVDESIEQAIADLAEVHPEATVEYDGAPGASVVAGYLFPVALYEILDNAVTYGGPDPSVRVRNGDGEVTITVVDSGSGLAISPPDSAFEACERGPESDGDGLGLFLADTIIDRYGGEIQVREGERGDEADGTVFEVRVPAA